MQIETPEWVHHAVFYQIFPDRFAISSRVPKPNNLQDWDSPPEIEGYKGGDLLGVVEHLDHIVELGCNAIYFTPVFQSASNHRYHTHDYYKVDPLLGGNDALRELLDACHAREIKVVLDGVFNHASRGFFQFNDILEHGPHSPYLDWFFVEGWPLSAYDGTKPANYVGWIGNRALPKFNTDNPQVREFIMKVAEFWLQFGIDGWRLDVPFEISTPGFWQEFRQRVKAINPEAYIVGEVWHDSRQWLQGDQFDAVMNYLFTGPTIAYTAGERVIAANVEGRSYDTMPALSARQYGEKIGELLGLYDWQIQLAQLNLLDSHDTARLLGIAGGDKTTVRLATILLMTYPGAPSIFYGDEIGLPGDLDPDSRRGMPWHRPEDWDQDMLAFHKHLIRMRHANPALRTGFYHQLYADDAVYAFVRQGEDATILVAVNAANEPRTVEIPLAGHIKDGTAIEPLYGQSNATVEGGSVRLRLLARDGIVLR
ncbi:MAG: alpha-glucosidase C-terminal domain-containing protein [Roseiflexaceae bacterium]|nr:alpha-glucosidase C-terminal domain-containing protein [Roseiflexaceae bacterium]